MFHKFGQISIEFMITGIDKGNTAFTNVAICFILKLIPRPSPQSVVHEIESRNVIPNTEVFLNYKNPPPLKYGHNLS